MAGRERQGRPLSGKTLRRAVPFIGLALALGLLWLVVDPRGALDALLAADPRWAGAGALLALNASLIVAVKVWAAVRIVECPRTLRECWSAVMAAVSLNAVLPARGGDLVRAVFLDKGDSSLALLVGAVLLERLADLFTIGLLAMITVQAFDLRFAVAASVAGGAVLLTVMLAVVGPRMPFKPALGERMARASRYLVRHPGYAGLLLLTSMLTWLNNAGVMLCGLRAVGADVPLGEALHGTTLAIIAGILPLSISGIGTRDAVLVGVLGPFAAPEQLAAAGLIYTAEVYWLLALFGAMALGPATLRAVRNQLRAQASS
jgi:uncharacterized membrane protein YbhN (UPF0104 family)